MLGMGKLSYDYKIPGRSIAEVHGRFEEALLHHQRGRRVLFRGRKLTAEALVNAVLMQFLERPPEEQERLLQEYVARFESLVTGEDEAPGSGSVAQPVDLTKARKRRAR